VSWKDRIQVCDLGGSDRLELLCRRCGHLRYLTGEELLARKSAVRLTLAEVEQRARCRQRGCGGAMRLAMPNQGDTVGFVGGIA
jgi:hypothetical protein